ncbi:DUF805 domain-containing protein [soil metagenome]
MSFTDAVKSAFDNYVNFDGRASRSAFWWFVLFEVLVLFGLYIIGAALFDSAVLYFLGVLALFLPALAVAIRRLHDTNRSGWWYLIGLIPFGGIVLIVFWVQDSDPGDNDHGPPPADKGPGAAAPPPAPAA